MLRLRRSGTEAMPTRSPFIQPYVLSMRASLLQGDIPVHRLKDEDFQEDEEEGRGGDEEEKPLISSSQKDTDNLQRTPTYATMPSQTNAP